MFLVTSSLIIIKSNKLIEKTYYGIFILMHVVKSVWWLNWEVQKLLRDDFVVLKISKLEDGVGSTDDDSNKKVENDKAVGEAVSVERQWHVGANLIIIIIIIRLFPTLFPKQMMIVFITS
jgi:hypothetical protein